MGAAPTLTPAVPSWDADRDALRATAARALDALRAQGFDAAQAAVSVVRADEFNIAHNQPSLLRSTEQRRVALTALVDGRRASLELAADDDAALKAGAAELMAQARSAPQDAANALSAGQTLVRVQGPQRADLDLLAAKLAEVLAFRATHAPGVMLEEGTASHELRRSVVLGSAGTDLATSVGAYSLSVFGTAHDGPVTSSFNAAGGSANALDAPAPSLFGMGDMIQELPRQVHTRPLGERFQGEVVLTPPAVTDLLTWLLGQLGDTQLIAGSSLYRQRVGEAIASPRLGLRSRPDGAGTSPVSADAHVAAEVTVIDGGRLCTLLPSLYGARKTGLPHVPVADGWAMDAGDTPRAALAHGLVRGAWVGRLSMGMPASNGDFSGIIKNSFLIEDGRIGGALTETMITGNVAQMLRDIVAVSTERLDVGDTCLPWLRIGGLHFS